MHPTYKKWIEDGKPKVICRCGCNDEIIVKNHHKYVGIPKYIHHHGPCSSHFKKGHHPSNGFKKGHVPWNKDKTNVYDKETLERMSKAKEGYISWNKGLTNIYTKDTIQKMSNAKKGQNLGHSVPPNSGYGKGCYYESQLQGKIWLRSSYELKFAEWLDKNEIPWLYEIQTFDLGNTTYTPDFYLPTCNMFIEIKGYMKKEAQEKINKFLDNYNEETLKILYKEDLIKLGIKL